MIRQIYCFVALFFLSLNTFAQYSKYVDPDDGLGEFSAQGMGSVYLTLVLLAIFFIILDKGGKQTFLRVVAYILGFLAYLGLIVRLGMILQEEISPTKSGVGFITLALILLAIWIPIWIEQKSAIVESSKKVIYISALVGLLLVVLAFSQPSQGHKSEPIIVKSNLSSFYEGDFIYRSLRDSADVNAKIRLTFFKKNNANYGHIKIISNACNGDFEGVVNKLSGNKFEMKPEDQALINGDALACRITISGADGGYEALNIQENSCQYFRGFECSFNGVLYKKR